MSIITFSDYKEKIERLITDETLSIDDFDLEIEDLVYQIPTGALQLENNQLHFVIRTSLLNADETCTNVSRCSYVPDCLKDNIPLQRCNIEKQQVFYASIPGGMLNLRDGAQPSLMETTMQKIIDDPTFNLRDAAVSRWRIKVQPIFWYLPHYSHSILKNQNFKSLHEQFDTFLKNDCEPENYQNFTEKLNYLSGLFCGNYNRERTYKVTAAYYNTVMRLFKPFNNGCDALIYPSANTEGEGMNIVLTKEYVDRKSIYCDLVVLYKIIRNPNNLKNIRFIPYAQAKPDENGNLDFKPLNGSIH